MDKGTYVVRLQLGRLKRSCLLFFPIAIVRDSLMHAVRGLMPQTTSFLQENFKVRPLGDIFISLCKDFLQVLAVFAQNF